MPEHNLGFFLSFNATVPAGQGDPRLPVVGAHDREQPLGVVCQFSYLLDKGALEETADGRLMPVYQAHFLKQR